MVTSLLNALIQELEEPRMISLFKSYDEEYLELYEYLTQDWRMKPGYAKAFLTEYKKSIGKILAEGKKRMAACKESGDSEELLLAMANIGQEYPFALVAQAYYAYMGDLRRGKHVGTAIEKTIWAILYNRSDLLSEIDKPMEKWIDDQSDEKFPGLFGEVFQYD